MTSVERGRSRAERSHSRALSESKMPLRDLSTRDYAIGIGLLLCVVFLWTFSNFVTQNLFDDGFDKPFWVTYLNTSSFALYLIPVLRRWVLRRKDKVPQHSSNSRSGDYMTIPEEDERPEPGRLRPSSDTIFDDDLPPLTDKQTARLASEFCVLWFAANWTVNASLGYTSVASTTILSSMSGFFTLIIGQIFRVERLTLPKVAAVVTSFCGVLLVSLSDSSSSVPNPEGRLRRPLFGDALALLSALFYALYVILLKVRIQDESRVDMQLFFGFVGAFNILGAWPIGVLLHVTGGEPFAFPHGRNVIVAVLVNMAITLSSDYLYVLAMLKTAPLVVTVGLSLTIPLAVIGDLLLGRPSAFIVVAGAALVLGSFVVMGLSDARAREEEEETDTSPVRLHEDVSARSSFEDP